MNDDSWKAIGQLFLIIAIIYGGFLVYQNFIIEPFEEVSGTVKYDDCREKINLKGDQLKDLTGTYICNDSKTNSGKSMGGECVKIITDSTGKCQTAYVYEKPAEESCGSNSYLTVDDKCSCSYGYILRGDSCISNTQDCINSFGPNSWGATGNTPTTSTCYCNSGYFWNYDKTKCVAY